MKKIFLITSAVFGFAFTLPGQLWAAEPLSPQGVADVARPGVVHIGTHITGMARIPAIKVDVRARQMEVVPDSIREIPVDEYLSGSGFVVEEGGFIATNAHVVSIETLKHELASESALAALFESALYLSDAEMDALLNEGEAGFARGLLRFVIQNSDFTLESKTVLLDARQESASFAEAVSRGLPVTIVSESEGFLEGGPDVALLRADVAPAPSLLLGKSDTLSVGSRVYLLGFPATAELSRSEGVASSLTSGVVSAIRVTPEGRKIYQTDAKVSQGSSGGPLLNEAGEVVGIVTFQTEALERENGDNFAFAQDMENLSVLTGAARIEPGESQYSRSFREGFRLYAQRRCEKAFQSFQEAEKVHPFFSVTPTLEGYRSECRSWQQAGTSRDTFWSAWTGFLGQRDLSVWFLFAATVVFGAGLFFLLLWLLRQVRRDELEIGRLEQRLQADERFIRNQDKLLRQKLAPTAPAPSRLAEKPPFADRRSPSEK